MAPDSSQLEAEDRGLGQCSGITPERLVAEQFYDEHVPCLVAPVRGRPVDYSPRAGSVRQNEEVPKARFTIQKAKSSRDLRPIELAKSTFSDAPRAAHGYRVANGD
jgi:hypothetical protein